MLQTAPEGRSERANRPRSNCYRTDNKGDKAVPRSGWQLRLGAKPRGQVGGETQGPRTSFKEWGQRLARPHHGRGGDKDQKAGEVKRARPANGTGEGTVGGNRKGIPKK